MNAFKAIPKHPPNARFTPRTVNIYRKAFPDPLRRGQFKTLGLEDPRAKIANTVSWLLRRAKKEGLTTRSDGYVRVQDLLQHPTLEGCDFTTLERAVGDFRSHQLKFVYAPRHHTPENNLASQVACWWIGQQATTYDQYTDQRVTNPDEIPELVYCASIEDWPELQKRGISRGSGPPISFRAPDPLPLHYQEGHTYIRVNTSKILTQSDIKLYRSRTLDPERRNKPRETIDTPSPNIPPSMFESVIRTSIERFPLVLREPLGETKTKGRVRVSARLKVPNPPGKVVVVRGGIDALKRLGYEHALRGSGLELMLREQEQEKEQERLKNKGTAKKRRRRQKKSQQRKVEDSCLDSTPKTR